MSEQFYKSRKGEPLTIAGFIRREVPADWQNWSVKERRAWWAGAANNALYETTGRMKRRDKITAIEIWVEFYMFDSCEFSHKDARAINRFLSEKLNLRPVTSPFRCGPYSVQRGFYVDPPCNKNA